MRQIVKDIESRQKAQRLRRELVVEWQTKTLASFIANTVQVKGSNPLLKAVDKVRLVDKKELEGMTQQSGPKPEDDPEIYVEQGSQIAESRNKPGSFEALLQGFRETPPA
jgi:hypothetical protein